MVAPKIIITAKRSLRDQNFGGSSGLGLGGFLIRFLTSSATSKEGFPIETLKEGKSPTE